MFFLTLASLLAANVWTILTLFGCTHIFSLMTPRTGKLLGLAHALGEEIFKFRFSLGDKLLVFWFLLFLNNYFRLLDWFRLFNFGSNGCNFDFLSRPLASNQIFSLFEIFFLNQFRLGLFNFRNYKVLDFGFICRLLLLLFTVLNQIYSGVNFTTDCVFKFFHFIITIILRRAFLYYTIKLKDFFNSFLFYE